MLSFIFHNYQFFSGRSSKKKNKKSASSQIKLNIDTTVWYEFYQCTGFKQFMTETHRIMIDSLLDKYEVS